MQYTFHISILFYFLLQQCKFPYCVTTKGLTYFKINMFHKEQQGKQMGYWKSRIKSVRCKTGSKQFDCCKHIVLNYLV